MWTIEYSDMLKRIFRKPKEDINNDKIGKKVGFSNAIVYFEPKINLDIDHEYKKNEYLAMVQANNLGSFRDLAHRSLLRASDLCNCSCEFQYHDHHNVMKTEDKTVYCGISEMYVCKICNANICAICYDQHQKVHKMNLLTG